jgi:hypothetical protein
VQERKRNKPSCDVCEEEEKDKKIDEVQMKEKARA